MKQSYYPGIDRMRAAAALLVIAVHTSPLSSYSAVGDFMLTRVTARLAVPFFFMASGFFLLSRYADGPGRLVRFVRRTAALYGLAILLYMPLALYNGYLHQRALLPNIIRDIVFDGTFYHLWYLPAAALGAVIAWLLLRKLGYRRALAAAAGLYLIGLLGDSYYGAAVKVGMEGFYRLLFQIMDHTRNGLFFAPVFFLLGGCLRPDNSGQAVRHSNPQADPQPGLQSNPQSNPQSGSRPDRRWLNLIGLAVSFLFMLAEALTLRRLPVVVKGSF